MDNRIHTYMISGEMPESMSFKDIVVIVIPSLRKKIINLIRDNAGEHDWVIPTEWNMKAYTILDRAKAIYGDMSGMTGYELNNTVKILREELYLTRIALQKRGGYKEIPEPWESY